MLGIYTNNTLPTSNYVSFQKIKKTEMILDEENETPIIYSEEYDRINDNGKINEKMIISQPIPIILKTNRSPNKIEKHVRFTRNTPHYHSKSRKISRMPTPRKKNKGKSKKRKNKRIRSTDK
jgi:hypothetical protein